MQTIKLFVDFNLSRINNISDAAKKLSIPLEALRTMLLREEIPDFSEYILERKVTAMKELLIRTPEPCYAVCINVGLFEENGPKTFKRFTGMTMMEFRNKNRRSNKEKSKQEDIIERDKADLNENCVCSNHTI